MVYLNDIPDLHFCELQALRLDGELSETYGCVSVPENSRVRAERVLGADAHRLVLCSWSAAWAWGCAPEPHPHLVTYRQARVHITLRSGLVVEQRSLAADDIDGGITTPLRTVCDLLKNSTNDDDVVQTVRALMGEYTLTEQDVWGRITRNPTASHKQAITRRLRRVSECYPSETR